MSHANLNYKVCGTQFTVYCTKSNRKKHVLCLWCLWYLLLGLFIFRTVRCVDDSKLWAQGPNLGSILKLIHHAGCLELSLIYCSSAILGFSWLYMRTTVTCHTKLCNIQGLDNVCTHTWTDFSLLNLYWIQLKHVCPFHTLDRESVKWTTAYYTLWSDTWLIRVLEYCLCVAMCLVMM